MYKRRQYAFALICCGAAICSLAAKSPSVPTIHFMDKAYRLVSFDQKGNPTWAFFNGSETADTWTTRFTISDRPDAHSREDLKKVTDEVKSDYESHGAKVLMAKPMNDANGEYNYTVVGFDDAAKQRYELSFVKTAVGKKGGYVAVYSVRITDPKDYANKTKSFLHQHSGEVGNALGQTELPSMEKLPRTGF